MRTYRTNRGPFATRPEPGEEPADVLSGGVYSSGDYLLCEIDWIDRPSPGEVTQLLEAAADAVDAAA